MKKILLSISLISALLVYSCSDMKKNLSEGLHESLTGQNLSFIPYNDSIVELQSRVVKAIDNFNKTTSSNIDTVLYEALEIYKRDMDEALDKLSSMGPFEGDDSFRQAGVDLFKFYRGLADVQYPELIRFYSNDSLSAADSVKIIIDSMENVSNKNERILLEKFLNAQNAMAEKYNTPLSK